MAVRTGMANVIKQLRSLTNAGSSEYTVDGVTYFIDQQLQDELDQDRTQWYDVVLNAVPRRTASSVTYLDYVIPDDIGDWFEEDATDSGWQLKDGSSNYITQSGNYTVSYRAKQITLTVDALGAARFLDCRTYDLYCTAARIWRMKAGFEQRAINWSNGQGINIQANQRYLHCVERAEFFEKKSGPTYSQFVRLDEM